MLSMYVRDKGLQGERKYKISEKSFLCRNMNGGKAERGREAFARGCGII